MNDITPMEQSRSSSQKLPVILVLDTSGSMEGQGMADLNQAIQSWGLPAMLSDSPSQSSMADLNQAIQSWELDFETNED